MTNEAKVREVVAEVLKNMQARFYSKITGNDADNVQIIERIAAAVCRELCVKDHDFSFHSFCIHCGYEPEPKDGDA